jgi:hypothetical protein
VQHIALRCNTIIDRLRARRERSEVLVGDSAQLADLYAAKLAGAQQEVDLVASDVQHFGDLLNGVCLQCLTSSGSGLATGRLLSLVTLGSSVSASAKRKCVPMSADAREACACAPGVTERHRSGGPCARYRA